jgi:alpha-beta hydrolase superfamily lysophospholipase
MTPSERIQREIGKTILMEWPYEQAAECIVLVHGLRGDPLKTWQRFLLLLAGSAFAQNKDVISYGYDNSLRTKPAQVYDDISNFNSFLRTALRRYRSIYFITHSFGSVLTVGAVPELHALDPAWLNKLKGMIMLAPALWGLHVLDDPPPKLLGVRLPFFKLVPRQNILLELSPSSPTLQALRERWTRLAAQLPFETTIVLGTKDSIVARAERELAAMHISRLTLPVGHVHIAKADSFSDPLFLAIMETLRRYESANFVKQN